MTGRGVTAPRPYHAAVALLGEIMGDPLPVVIVIPVFNALAQTRACLNAVAATVASGQRVVVVDDASTDPAVLPALREATTRHGFELWANERNLGFLGTCNRAFAEVGDADVVLLNSDTVPTAGWLDAMVGAVGPGVASVTATSNAATIYSLPYPGVDPFSPDLDIDDLGAIVRSRVPAEPLAIPVGVGFCMLFTRTALDSIGTFDPAYGMGYGEENDWCMRARRAGFHHLLAPHAFVYHEGNASMADAGVIERGTTTHAANQQLLATRYPEHDQLVSEFLAEPTIHVYRQSVAAGIVDHLGPGRPRILHWLHADPFGPAPGGTEQAVRFLVEAFGREFVATAVFPDDGRLVAVTTANGARVTRSIEIASPELIVHPAKGWRDVAAAVIDIEQPDVFHYHHGYLTSASVVSAAQQAGIPTVVSVHDFHLICPRNHLFDRWRSYCGVPEASVCDACIGDRRIAMADWRRLGEEVLSAADRVVVTDQSVIDLLERAVDLPARETIVIVPPQAAAAGRAAPVRPAAGPATGRILIPGRIEAHHKGSLIVDELVDRLATHGIEVHSIGSDDFEARPGFVVHGTYRRAELTGLLAEIDPDLAIIPSVVPESYSLTLSELWDHGIPVLARDVGALGRRIGSSGGGFLVDAGDAAGFASAAIEALGDAEALAEARRHAVGAGVAASGPGEDGIARHRAIYRELAGRGRVAAGA